MPNLVVSDTSLSRRVVQVGRLEIGQFETSGPPTEEARDENVLSKQVVLLQLVNY